MSYNGIGLPTPRGSGTSGYVQKNLSHVSKSREKVRYKTEEDLRRLDSGQNRTPNHEILMHEKKRKLELKVFEMKTLMEDQGLGEEEIECKVSSFRHLLEEDFKKNQMTIPKDEFGRPLTNETHHQAQANIEKNKKMKEAFGISSYFVEGSSLDPDRVAKEAMAAELDRAKSREEAEKSLLEDSFEKSRKKRKRERSRSPSHTKRKRQRSPSSKVESEIVKKQNKEDIQHPTSAEKESSHSSKRAPIDENDAREASRKRKRDATHKERIKGQESPDLKRHAANNQESPDLNKYSSKKSASKSKNPEIDVQKKLTSPPKDDDQNSPQPELTRLKENYKKEFKRHNGDNTKNEDKAHRRKSSRVASIAMPPRNEDGERRKDQSKETYISKEKRDASKDASKRTTIRVKSIQDHTPHSNQRKEHSREVSSKPSKGTHQSDTGSSKATKAKRRPRSLSSSSSSESDSSSASSSDSESTRRHHEKKKLRQRKPNKPASSSSGNSNSSSSDSSSSSSEDSSSSESSTCSEERN